MKRFALGFRKEYRDVESAEKRDCGVKAKDTVFAEEVKHIGISFDGDEAEDVSQAGGRSGEYIFGFGGKHFADHGEGEDEKADGAHENETENADERNNAIVADLVASVFGEQINRQRTHKNRHSNSGKYGWPFSSKSSRDRGCQKGTNESCDSNQNCS